MNNIFTFEKRAFMKLHLFFLIFMCGSCVVQKRHFQPGWDVQWKKHNSSTTDNSTNHIEKSIIKKEISIASIDAPAQRENLKSENSSFKESTFQEGMENFQVNFFNADQACKVDLKQHPKKIAQRINLKEVMRKAKSEDSSEPNSWRTFWYISFLIVLLVGGVFLLVFGTHWSLIVLGILSLAILVANLIFWVYIFFAFGIWIKIIP